MNQTPENLTKKWEEPRHWVGAEELNPNYWSDPAIQEKRGQEFHDKPIETMELIEKLDTQGIARRDFMTLMGASMAMAGFACARRPVHKIIPYVVKPEEVTGGVANWYASSCPLTGAALLVKVREGRPVKLEGNPDHPAGGGALTASEQASILDLYDNDRLKYPLKRRTRGASGVELTWDQVDQEVGSALTASRSVALVTPSLLSPSTRALIGDFGKKFSRFKQVEFSTAGNDSLFKAQELNYGTAVIPSYRFDRADVVVSFGADFLGTWLSPSEFSNQWSKTRQLKSKDSGLSKLYVVESTLSLTGSNADERIAVDSGDEFVLALALAHELIVKKGLGSFAANLKNELQTAAPKNLDSAVAKKVSEMANHLASNQGRSLVIAGGVAAQSKNALELQVLVNAINSALGNEGHTVDGVVSPFGYQKTSAADLKSLIAEMSEGKIDTLILYRSNLAYHLPLAFGFKEALKKVKTVVVISDREDETSLLADYTLADHHYLENWGDVEFKKGTVSLQQPALAPIHNTRSFQDSLIGLGQLKGSGSLVGNDWHEKLQSYWKNNFYKETKPISVFGTFEQFWEKCLKEGVLVLNRSMPKQTVRSFNFNGSVHFSSATSNQQEAVKLTLYHKVGMGDGTQANNAWIQEFPEPVSTATWDNYLNIGPSFAKKLGIENDDIVEVKSTNGAVVELPALVQPGLKENVVSAALGYGRTAVGKVGNKVGQDMTPFLVAQQIGNQAELISAGIPVTLRKTGRRYQVAITQWHHVSENRPIINDITLEEFKKNPGTSNHTDPHLRMESVPSMWPKHEYKGYRWGMSIDLTSCTGCGACIIGCQAENNIPVVGRDNVRKSREMHWLRLDRYYSGSPEEPNVIFQPMICQHCENAPCETVCPVLATVHSSEGLNEQVYNRCVGTRYCQNNCPYKVRRFNFFDHWKNYEGSMNLAWNPDVTVRTRGIMEKCSFCVQRINEAKDHAKDQSRKVKDGEIKTACQQTCPTDAIVFGDMNDPQSLVSKLKKDQRDFRVLEVLNTVPAVSYLTKVRNQKPSSHGHHENAKSEHKE